MAFQRLGQYVFAGFVPWHVRPSTVLKFPAIVALRASRASCQKKLGLSNSELAAQVHQDDVSPTP